MLIDWFTVAAQAVNFLILMWLLKRFLYRPVLNAIDEREAGIVKAVKNAESQQRAAENEHALCVRKNEDFDRDRAGMLGLAREEARATGEQLLERERLAAEASRARWRSGLADEQRRLGDEIVHRIQEEVFAVLRQAFADLADTTLEARMIEVFGRRLRLAKETPGGVLYTASRAAPATLLVKSAFELSAEQQAALRQTIAEAFSAEVAVKFETAANLISGIELLVDGRKVSWAVADYLFKLKNGISDLLDTSSSRTPGKATELPSA